MMMMSSHFPTFLTIKFKSCFHLYKNKEKSLSETPMNSFTHVNNKPSRKKKKIKKILFDKPSSMYVILFIFHQYYLLLKPTRVPMCQLHGRIFWMCFNTSESITTQQINSRKLNDSFPVTFITKTFVFSSCILHFQV